MTGRVLVVDDDPSMCELLEVGLVARGFDITWTTSAVEALEIAATAGIDAVVTDLNMRGVSGLQLCERVVASRPDVPVIVITAFGSMETVIAAIRAGAYDFMTKPLELDDLALALTRALQHRALLDERTRLRRAVEDAADLRDPAGVDPASSKGHDLFERVAERDASALIPGDKGKELIARVLRRRGE
jgi:two-component system, NtrC family, response regulator AtoC